MKNVTITIEDEIARWARVRAAEEGVSLSRLVARLLGEMMEGDHAYERAQRRYLGARPAALKREGGYPAREDLHDRALLRR